MLLSSLHRYADYRELPKDEEINAYGLTPYYWRLLAVRLAFVVIFENIIASLTSLMRWIIPDVPQQLRQQMRQHAYLTNELIMQQEYKRAKEMGSDSNKPPNNAAQRADGRLSSAMTMGGVSMENGF